MPGSIWIPIPTPSRCCLPPASLLQHEVETTQIGSPDSSHSCLTITSMFLLHSFLFFFTDQVVSVLLTHPHPFTCYSTSCTYHFDNPNVHPHLQPPPVATACTPFSCHAPPLSAVLLAVGSLSATLSACLLCCLLTSPHISHRNDMQHLCALARCMPQVCCHGVRVGIQVVSGA